MIEPLTNWWIFKKILGRNLCKNCLVLELLWTTQKLEPLSFVLVAAKTWRSSENEVRWNEVKNRITYTAWKVSKYGVFSGPCFPVFALNTEIYSVILCIQPEYRKKRTRKKNPYLDTFHVVIMAEYNGMLVHQQIFVPIN